MQRITDTTAGASLPAPPALTGTTGYFKPAVPGVSAATKLRYWFVNMLQEELMSVLAAASVAADTTGTVFNQLLLSIQALIGAIPHGVTVYTSPGSISFTVPSGVTAIEVEVWGGGAGSYASTTTIAAGGGAGGGYARKKITGLTPATVIPGTVGAGGVAGTTVPAAPTAGGATSFGSGPYLSAAGGALNTLATTSQPSFGGHSGVGSNGDVNLNGGDGGMAIGTQGGLGGGGPLSGGGPNSGTTGNAGYAPGGGASGPGNPSSTAYAGAAGAAGAIVVRW